MGPKVRRTKLTETNILVRYEYNISNSTSQKQVIKSQQKNRSLRLEISKERKQRMERQTQRYGNTDTTAELFVKI